ncbi:MAG: AEC family transporter [Sphaerochaetaceae bacterium]|nr:AEC family transporter [Sphaerochaetaceae bacterium]
MTQYFPQLFQLSITLLLIISTGFVCSKLKIIDESGKSFLSKFILYILQPFIIVHSIYSPVYTTERLMMALTVLLISFVTHILLIGLGFIFFGGFKKIEDKKVAIFLTAFGNVGFFGYPVLDIILPDLGRFLGAFFVIGFNLSMWSLGIMVYSYKRPDIKVDIKKVFLNPGSIPCYIGLFLYLLKGLLQSINPSFVFPPCFVDFTKFIADCAIPTSFIIVGCTLASSNFKELLSDIKVYYQAFIKLIVIPFIVFFIMKALKFNKTYILLITTLAASPAASIGVAVSNVYNMNPKLAAKIVSFTTILVMITLPFIVSFIQTMC